MQDRFNDNLADMKQIAKGAAITFTEALIPSLIGVQEYFIKAVTGANDFSAAAETLIRWVKQLVGAFILLKGILASVGTILVGIVAAFGAGLSAIGGALMAMNSALAASLAALSKGDFAASASVLADMPGQIADAWNAGAKEMADALKFIPENISDIKDQTDASLAEMEKAFTMAAKPGEELGGVALDTARDFGKLNKAADEARAKDTQTQKSGRALSRALPIGPADQPWHSSQYPSLPEVYVQNASLEIAWSRVVIEGRTIAGYVVMPFLTRDAEGFDVNNPYDWEMPMQMLKTREAKLPNVPQTPFT